ncbi:MAG TPA: metallophosphoesterase [Acidimicrobiales bacterium]|nr:metallophosphoesterase [Acidimicrobiales bacterium]
MRPSSRGAVPARLPRWQGGGVSLHRLRVVMFAAAGAIVALALAGSTAAKVGPFDTTMSVRPSFTGETTVRLAPLGRITLDTHDAPFGIELRVDELRLAEAKRFARDPTLIEKVGDELTADVRRAAGILAIRCLVAAVAGGVVGGALARPRWRTLFAGGSVGLALAVTAGAAGALTFDGDALAEPHYSGLLTVAPTAVGDVRTIVERFDRYRTQLVELVANVAALYDAAQGLPSIDPGEDTIRVLHVSDVHLNPQAFDLMHELVRQFDAEAILDTGDITDWGSEPEAQLLSSIPGLGVPYVWVRGNHDSIQTQRAVAAQPNAIVLDGDGTDVAGLRVWGIGDPRYTPDKDQPVGPDVEKDAAEAFAPEVDRRLEDGPDVVLIHDARAAADLGGDVPLVLAGHTHRPREGRIGKLTRLLVEGSTGGAGLRGLQGDDPVPLSCSLLHFDRESKALVAYDRVAVRGLGQTGVTIERHVVRPLRDTTVESTTTSVP